MKIFLISLLACGIAAAQATGPYYPYRVTIQPSIYPTLPAASSYAAGTIVEIMDGATTCDIATGGETIVVWAVVNKTATAWVAVNCGGGSSGLTVGTTTITGGTPSRIEYNNGGVLGEYSLSGTGTTVPLTASPAFTGTPTAPTAAAGDTTTQIATDAFATAAAQNGAINALAYGALPNGHYVTDATTNSTTTVTCPNNDCNFTSSMVGQIVFGVYGNSEGTNEMISGVLVVPQGTISVVNSAQSITVSSAATASHAATVTLVWGSDNSAALASAFTAATAVCPILPIILPAGMMLVQQGEFTNFGGNCLIGSGTSTQIPSSLARSGVTVIGAGQGATYLVPTPSFNFTTLVGPKGGLFGDNGNGISSSALANNGTYFSGWSIWGGGYTASNPATGTYVFVGGGNATFKDVACLAWGATESNLGGMYLQSAPIQLFNVQIDGCGGTVGIQNSSTQSEFYSVYSGDSYGVPLKLSGSGYFADYGGVYGPELHTTAIINQSAGTADFFGTYSNFGSTNVGNTSLILMSAGTQNWHGSKLGGSATSSTGAVFDLSGGTVSFVNTSVIEGGSAGYGIYNRGSTVLDLGGNVVTGVTANFDNASGTCCGPALSITGTYLANSGVVLTSGWGGTGTASTVTGASGDSHFGSFTVNSNGTGQAASPSVTLTFPVPYWVAPSGCTITDQTGGTFGTLSNPVPSSLGATSVVFTWTGTPVSSNSYTFRYECH